MSKNTMTRERLNTELWIGGQVTQTRPNLFKLNKSVVSQSRVTQQYTSDCWYRLVHSIKLNSDATTKICNPAGESVLKKKRNQDRKEEGKKKERSGDINSSS